MRISIIAAVAENGVIGRGGQAAVASVGRLAAVQAADDGPHDHHGPADVGIDRPAAAGAADGRRHAAERTIAMRRACEVAASLDDALRIAAAAGDDEAFVVGGAEMYRQALAAGRSALFTDARAGGRRRRHVLSRRRLGTFDGTRVDLGTEATRPTPRTTIAHLFRDVFERCEAEAAPRLGRWQCEEERALRLGHRAAAS